MSAKFRSFEHLLKPDPKYKNKLMGKFINCLMEGGKKSTAQKIFYSALDEVHKRSPTRTARTFSPRRSTM